MVDDQDSIRKSSQRRGFSHFSWVKSSGSRATSNWWAGSSNSFVRVSIGRRKLQYSPSCTASSTLKLFLRRFFSLIRGARTSAETQNSIIEPLCFGKLYRMSILQEYLLSALWAKPSSFMSVILSFYVFVPSIDGLTLVSSRMESCRI